MWGFAFFFWLLPVLFFSFLFRRRWGYPQRWGNPPRWDRDPRWSGLTGGTLRELEEQRGTIERLEAQVAQLEERLDFTERLLAGRREAPAAG